MLKNGTIYSFKLKRNIGYLCKKGYLKIDVDNNPKFIHRIIWMVANKCNIPEGYDVHHIDGNKLNNSIYNLELVEHSEHSEKHIHHNDEVKKKLSIIKSKNLIQYSLDNKIVKIWKSSKECGENGYSQQHVNDCCNGKRKTHKGFKWKYIDYDNKRE